MIIIGLSGKKKSGKDTFYEIASKMLTVPSVKIAFADALKEEVAKACGVSVEFVETNKIIFRPMLQFWGTDFKRRLIDNEYWIRQLFHKLSEVMDDIGVVFITDVRFKNEARWIEEVGILVRINRDMCDVNDLHISETDLDSYDFKYIIENNGTLEDYKRSIRTVMNKIIEATKSVSK